MLIVSHGCDYIRGESRGKFSLDRDDSRIQWTKRPAGSHCANPDAILDAITQLFRETAAAAVVQLCNYCNQGVHEHSPRTSLSLEKSIDLAWIFFPSFRRRASRHASPPLCARDVYATDWRFYSLLAGLWKCGSANESDDQPRSWPWLSFPRPAFSMETVSHF